MEDDALTSGGYYGFPGDSVYGAGNHAAYGVFNGADGYGSPYFAGYYGPRRRHRLRPPSVTPTTIEASRAVG